MHIELTEQQRQLAQEGQPIDLVDPQTNIAYVLLIRQQFDCLHSLPAAPAFVASVPEGIRLSLEAFRHDLPQLLAEKQMIVGIRTISPSRSSISSAGPGFL